MTSRKGPINPERDVIRFFGDCRYWHYVDGAPSGGTLADNAVALLKIVETYAQRSFQNWPISQFKIKAMSLELAMAFSKNGEPMTTAMLKLLAWAMGVPSTFLQDPTQIYSGHDGKGQAANPEWRTMAEFLDARYLASHGGQMPINALAKQIKEAFKLPRPPSRSTIREWQKDPDYQRFVEFAAQNTAKADLG
jgi:hypothetical protein